jgi:hypothetical protein
MGKLLVNMECGSPVTLVAKKSSTDGGNDRDISVTFARCKVAKRPHHRGAINTAES